MTTVTGISDHYGCAELVTISVRDGAPVILNRQRAQLIAHGLAASPYHHDALKLSLAKAERVVEKTRASVAEHCHRALSAIRSSFGVDGVAIQTSPYPELPASLAQILASRPLTNAADGMLYREELAAQAAALGMSVHRFPRKADQIAAAAKALGSSAADVGRLLSAFGASVGVPWRKEHQHAAAAALCLLAGHLMLRRRPARSAQS